MKTLRHMFGLSPSPMGRPRGTGDENRRQSTRYASSSAIVLGWWDGDEFRTAEGALLDISQGGAAIAVHGKDAPPPGPAHLRLADSPRDSWTDAEVLSVRGLSTAASIAHLQFRGTGSYAIFREALNNADLNGDAPHYDSAEFDTRYWRQPRPPGPGPTIDRAAPDEYGLAVGPGVPLSGPGCGRLARSSYPPSARIWTLLSPPE